MFGNSGKYRLDHRLGGGGMAEVFLGSMVGAEGFSRKVAIKRVLPGFSDNPAFGQMFVAEAQISAQLQHPNIVSVLDFDRDSENRLFLVMELVEGRDLDALVSSGLLPIPLVIFVISEVLRGLGHAHDLPVSTSTLRGIVHRDVSPHNVLLSWDGAVKVSDFGIAKAREASAATASLLIKGKPAYMSPEQANGEQLDGRSDLFAVGIMLWEMLVGRRLFVGDDTRATLAAVLFGQVPRPRSLRSEIPKDLERVVMKLLERDLPARYPTAEAAIHDLLECHDAPKAGRELLMKTLAERFPQNAPVRGSALRSRGGAPQPGHTPPHVSLPPNAGTMMDGQAGRTPVAAMPSLGAARGAPTATVGPAATVVRKSGAKTAILIAAGLFSAVLAFVVVMVVTKKHGTGTGSGSGSEIASSGSGSGSAAGSAIAVTQPTPIDAGMPDAPPVAANSPDAGVSDVAAHDHQKGASSIPTGHSPTEKKAQGAIHVTAMPTLTVTVDKTTYGDTPRTVPLAPGKHKVHLTNESGYDETFMVTIDPGKTQEITRFK
ncbi:MAG TPA: serine/threonine-protein kinase [Kofleriaceae bacterium]|nr:serine/threonine-protein kinase [Kofleriaceae bacterium]